VREVKEKQVGDLRVQVTQFGAREALKLWYKTLSLFAPFAGTAIGSFIVEAGDEGFDLGSLNLKRIDGDTLGLAFQRIFEQMDEEAFYAYATRMLKTTVINGRGVEDMDALEFDNTLAGRAHLIPKILLFVWEVNYGPLPLAGVIGTLREAVKPGEAPSPDTPNADSTPTS